jgi:hypothetical protein
VFVGGDRVVVEVGLLAGLFLVGGGSHEPLQLLFQTDYAVRQLLINELGLLHMCSHTLLQLLERHHGRVQWLGRLGTLLVFIDVNHLVGVFELLADL